MTLYIAAAPATKSAAAARLMKRIAKGPSAMSTNVYARMLESWSVLLRITVYH